MKMKMLTRMISSILCFALLGLMGCAGTLPGEPSPTPSGAPPVEGTTKPDPQPSAATPSSTAPGPAVVDTEPSTLSRDEKLELYRYVAEGEREWLASLQLENGAIPMTYLESGSLTVNPYFADFAALALLGGGETYHGAVRDYILWHFGHLNTAEEDYNGLDGTIYDYAVRLENGKLVDEQVVIKSNGKPSYDSVDSYAATFLCVLAEYYGQTGDKALLQENAGDIQRIFTCLASLFDGGLTWSKPDYRIKYLMDNCEVYEGLVAAERLFGEALDAPELAAEAAALREGLAQALEEEMWRPEGGYYEAALGESGGSAYTFTWDSFYPCATAQLMMISCGLLEPDSDRAVQLYNSFNGYYSTGEKKHTWEELSIPDNFFWGSIVYAGACMGDEYRVETYLQTYRKAMRTHAYPLYNADAARVCLAADKMLEKLEK